MNQEEKIMQYAAKAHAALMNMFSEDSELYIDADDLNEGENASYFFHAISTIAPALIYNQFADNEVDILGFNHISNRLLFQYSKPESENK